MKKGFTLVELSIVLVIIGLLIGGILVAQSMINTSKIQATIRQIGQFDASVSNFRTSFNGVPGDTNVVMTASAFMSGTSPGRADKDGLLLDYNGATINFSGEIGSFWNALSMIGLSTSGNGAGGNTFVQAANTAAANLLLAGTTANIPKLAAGKNAGAVAFSSGSFNWYGIVSTSQYTSSAFIDATASNNALKPVDAAAIDIKMDDGVANTGNVKEATTTAATGLAIGANATATSCTSGGTTYLFSTTTEACALAVKVGIQSGVQ